jgi:hypothetical protein
MKKIDLHVHTLATALDSPFTFCLPTLKDYVERARLDAIAITNHNIFDSAQFREIRESLPTVAVFPGIEISLDHGHILLISDGSGIADFESRCNEVRVSHVGDGITAGRLKEIYGSLKNYLLIPHYDKSPSIGAQTLEELSPHVAAGEVDSAKTFIRAIKDTAKLTPVLFSDVRVSDELRPLPTRQTFLDCGDLTIEAIRACLSDKHKVCLSADEGNSLFQVLENGQRISTALNVLLGDRSTGKTYTLNRISEACERAKYIKQFSLVQHDDKKNEDAFKADVERRRSVVVDRHLSPFKAVLEDMMKVDLDADDRDVEQYVSSLRKSAEDADKRDAFSKVALFDATPFPDNDDQVLKDLIASVRQVIENVKYREYIERHVDRQALKRLACDLIELLWNRALETKKMRAVNELVNDIKAHLKIRSSATQVDDVDLYRVSINCKRASRFSNIVKSLQQTSTVFEERVQGFRVVATTSAFATATELQNAIHLRTSFVAAMREYDSPYRYLRVLMSNSSLPRSDLYKLFVKIEYKILNRDGVEVSGGERSEFRLLQEINDAQNYDILLIDEPESSFDNMFLQSDVNQIIKEISQVMPVVVVTHNSTVGASIRPDYLLYASKRIESGKPVYRIYSGHPTDKILKSVDGESTKSHEIVLNSLEAGSKAYEDRRRGYAAIEDRR